MFAVWRVNGTCVLCRERRRNALGFPVVVINNAERGKHGILKKKKKKELKKCRKGKIWYYLIMRDRTINNNKKTNVNKTKNSGRQKTHDSAFMAVIFYAFFFIKLNLIFFTRL